MGILSTAVDCPARVDPTDPSEGAAIVIRRDASCRMFIIICEPRMETAANVKLNVTARRVGYEPKGVRAARD